MEIDTRTAPVFTTRSIVEIPSEYHAWISNWSTVLYKSFSFGRIISQTFTEKLYTIQVYHFVLNDPTPLIVKNPKGFIHLYLNLACPPPYSGGCEHVQHPGTGQFGLQYLYQGIHDLQLNAGEFHIIFIELANELLNDLAASKNEIRQLIEHKETAVPQDMKIDFLPISYMVRDLLRDMHQCRETGPDLQMELKTTIITLLNVYRKGLNYMDSLYGFPEHPYKNRLIEIAQEIKRDPHKTQHTLSYFSKKYALSESTLRRAFTDFFGKSLAGYVTEQCMQKAAWMTRDVGLNIEDIAEEIGYAEKSGFIRAFKRFHGKTPKQGTNDLKK